MPQGDSGSTGQAPLSPWTRSFAGDLLETTGVAGSGFLLFWLLRGAVGGQGATALVMGGASALYLFFRFRAVLGPILIALFALASWAVFTFLGSASNHFLIVAAFGVAFASGAAVWRYGNR